MTWRTLPKIELHMHLEGAAPAAFIRDLAKEKSVDISGVFDERGGYAFDGFANFLKVYEAATSVLQTPEDYARLLLAVAEQSARHGVVYSESFLSPDFCGGGDLSAWRDYLNAMEDAAATAEHELGITVRGIVTCIRHFGPAAAKPVARAAAETKGKFLRGFGMGGDESVGRQGDFSWAFDCAREAGLRLTSHAGEWGGPDSIRDAIRDLGVERIGHGVAAARDPALMEELIERDVHLEVCPGSNVALGLYSGFDAHPLAMLRDAEISVSVSTDDPPFFHTTMTREYEELARAFRWDEQDFSAINKMALDRAFCDDETRTMIEAKLERAA